METKKPHSRLSASWRTRKARGMIQPESKGPRISGGTRISGVSPGPTLRVLAPWGQDKIDVPAQTKSKFTLPSPFCTIQTLSKSDEAPVLCWGWSLCSLLIQLLISFRKTLIDTAIWKSLSTVKLSHGINHHSEVDFFSLHTSPNLPLTNRF